jgi:DNA polymerase IV
MKEGLTVNGKKCHFNSIFCINPAFDVSFVSKIFKTARPTMPDRASHRSKPTDGAFPASARGHGRRRWVAHLDMDAFYASVELLRYPQLQGMPVVIGGGQRHQPVAMPDGSLQFSTLDQYVGRGVITTATYPAREHGVNSGMGLMKAAKLAPHAVLLPTDFEAYRKASKAFKACVVAMAPIMEDRGIDEIYLELTDLPGAQDAVGHDPFGGVRAIAQDIRNTVRRTTGLTCSMGITPNKLLSKLASEMDKPDGLTVLTHDDLPSHVWPLMVRKLNGVGPKAAAKLQALGMRTIGDVADKDAAWLIRHFGRAYGHWLCQASHGVDDRAVSTRSEPVSMSRETTFDRDLHAVSDKLRLTAELDALVAELASDLARKGYAARTVGVKLRFDDFSIQTREITLPEASRDATTMRRALGQCLKRADLSRRLRLLGVRAANLDKRTHDD